MVRGLTERIQASAKDNSEALLQLNDGILQCCQTVKKLAHSYEKLSDQNHISRLKLLIKYWMNGKESKAVVDDLVKEIDDRLMRIQLTIQYVQFNNM